MADRSARSGGPAAGATVRPRAEHVGSFLRPDRLLGAARDARAGRLSAERFRELQDQCVREVVAFYREARASAYLREAEALLAASA